MKQESRWSSSLSNEEIRRLVQVRREHFPYPRLIHAPHFPCWRCGCQDWGDVFGEPERINEAPSLEGSTELWECSQCGARWNGHLDETTEAQLDEQKEELPYHPLIEGQNNPDGNHGWGDEHAPACTECGKHTDDGRDTSAYGWLCPRCFSILFG